MKPSGCGVLNPSIPVPDVANWSEDLSFQQQPLCAEDACPEQSQALALISPGDVASTGRVQPAEALAEESDRTLATATQNGKGFFPPSDATVSGKGQWQAQKKNEGFIVSHLWPQ